MHRSVLLYCCYLIAKSCRLCVAPWTVTLRLLCPWGSPGKNTGVGSHARLQGTFPSQGLTRVSCTAGGLSITGPPGPCWRWRGRHGGPESASMRGCYVQGLGKAGLSPEQHSHPISWERGLHVQHGNCPGSPAAPGACETSILSAGPAAPHTGRKLTRPHVHTHACARAT